MKWSATNHALKRVTERFGVKPESALNWINQRMDGADYVTNAPDEYGRMRRVFLNKGVIFHVSLTDDCVYTVMKTQRQDVWSDAIRKAAEREIRKFNAKVLANESELVKQRVAMEIEIIDLKTTLLSTRSETRRSALLTQLTEISAKLAEVERALNDNRRSVVKMAESFYSVM